MDKQPFHNPAAFASYPNTNPHDPYPHIQYECSTSSSETLQTSSLNTCSIPQPSQQAIIQQQYQIIRPNPQYPQNHKWPEGVPPLQHTVYMRHLLEQKESQLQTFFENESILRAQLAAVQQRCSAQEQDAHNLHGKLQSIGSETVSKSQFDIVINQNKTLSEDNTKLRQQIDKASRENKELLEAMTEIERLSNLNQKLAQDVDRGNEKLKKEREKKTKMKTNWESLKEIQKTWLVKKIQLESDVETFKEKVKDLEEKLALSDKSSKTNVNQLQAEIQELRTKIASYIGETGLLTSANSRLLNNMKSYVNENKTLEAKIEMLEADKQSETMKVEGLVKENESLKAKTERLEDEKQIFIQKVVEVEGENKELRKGVENLEAENKSQANQLSESYCKHSEEILELKEQSNHTTSKLLEAKKRIGKLEGESSKLKKAHASDRQELQQKRDAEIRRWGQENANASLQYKSKVDSLNKQIEEEKAFSKRICKHISNLKRLLSNSEYEVKRLKRLVETLNLEKAKVVGTANITKRIEELERENRELEEQLAENAKLLKSQEEELKGQLLVMQIQKTSLDSLEARKLELETSATGLKENILELEVAVTVKEETIQQLERNAEKNQEKVNNCEERPTVLSTTNSKLVKKRKSKSRKIGELYLLLNQRIEESNEATKRIENLKIQANKYKRRSEFLMGEYKSVIKAQQVKDTDGGGESASQVDLGSHEKKILTEEMSESEDEREMRAGNKRRRCSKDSTEIIDVD